MPHSDPIKAKEYQKQYRLKNREKLLRKSQKWFQENRGRTAELNRLWKQNNLERVRENNRKWSAKNAERTKDRCLKKNYGISLATFNALLFQQDNCCAICQEKLQKPCVDHNHKTRNIRGLLCQACNKGLGFFKDCSKRLLAAAEYLKTA